MCAQSAQQIVRQFCSAVEGEGGGVVLSKCVQRDVPYTNQLARVGDGMIVLPSGKSGTLTIPIPKSVELPGTTQGKLVSATLRSWGVRLQYQVSRTPRVRSTVLGVCIGSDYSVVATDGLRAIQIDGALIKQCKGGEDRRLESLNRVLSRKVSGSRRWDRVADRGQKVQDRTQRQVGDLAHKTARIVAEEFSNAKVYFFNLASTGVGGYLSRLIGEKTLGAIEVEDPRVLSMCPLCGGCNPETCDKCEHGLSGDLLVAVNTKILGEFGEFRGVEVLPEKVEAYHPFTYFEKHSRGYRASGSSQPLVEREVAVIR